LFCDKRFVFDTDVPEDPKLIIRIGEKINKCLSSVNLKYLLLYFCMD